MPRLNGETTNIAIVRRSVKGQSTLSTKKISRPDRTLNRDRETH